MWLNFCYVYQGKDYKHYQLFYHKAETCKNFCVFLEEKCFHGNNWNIDFITLIFPYYISEWRVRRRYTTLLKTLSDTVLLWVNMSLKISCSCCSILYKIITLLLPYITLRNSNQMFFLSYDFSLWWDDVWDFNPNNRMKLLYTERIEKLDSTNRTSISCFL